MATLRHGPPVFHCGWLDKEGANSTHWERYMRVSGTALSNSHTETSQPSWQISLLDCPISFGPRQYEFQIKLRRRVLSYFARCELDYESWKNAFNRALDMQIEHFYEFEDNILGKGAFAQVKLSKDKASNEQYAVKIINKQSYDSRQKQFLIREVKIMMQISNNNIVNTYDIFDSLDQLYLVIEYMKGGELFDFIADQGHLSEQRASQVMRDIIKGVDYLHDNGIVHCDIKPENILCKSKQWPLHVKLCDFGLANFYDRYSNNLSTMTALIGTPGYVAPEVVKHEPYGPPVDMWACGVVLYVMLSGRMPFYGTDDVQCLKRTADGIYSFPDREWKNVSSAAKSLVKALLQIKPERRLTAKAALQHRWLALPDQNSDALLPNDLTSIHSRTRKKIRKAVTVAVIIERLRELAGSNSSIPSLLAQSALPQQQDQSIQDQQQQPSPMPDITSPSPMSGVTSPSPSPSHPHPHDSTSQEKPSQSFPHPSSAAFNGSIKGS